MSSANLLLSRNGRTCPFGKYTASVETKIDESTREVLSRLAREAGMTDSEFLRELILVRVYGVERMRELYTDRLRRVAGEIA